MEGEYRPRPNIPFNPFNFMQNPVTAVEVGLRFHAKFGLSNEGMVRALTVEGALKTQRVIEAFTHVDRGIFAPPGMLAYAQMPLRHGDIHLSAPPIYAEVAELLMPISPGMSFLNIGSGTGYFSSIVAHFLYSDPYISTNHGIELLPDTLTYSRERVAQIPHAAGYVELFAGNAYDLDVPNSMRYDRIFVGSCASTKLKCLYELLEIGGVMVGPFQISTGAQQLRRITRVSYHEFRTEFIKNVSFANLVRPSYVAPKVVLPEKPWTIQCASTYTAEFRDAIRTTLLAVQRSVGAPTVDICIRHLFPLCSRHWFDQKSCGNLRASEVHPPSPANIKTGHRGHVHSESSSSSQPWLSCSSAGRPGCGSDGSPCSVTGASLASSENEAQGGYVEIFDDGRRHRIGMDSDPDTMTQHGVVSLDIRNFLALFAGDTDEPRSESETRSEADENEDEDT